MDNINYSSRSGHSHSGSSRFAYLPYNGPIDLQAR